MDYKLLHEMLPKDPKKWSVSDTQIFLNFIGLSSITPTFKQLSVDGSIIQSLTQSDLRDEMHIKSNIVIKKLMSWINFGIKQYENYFNEQNALSFKGNSTIQVQDKSIKSFKKPNIDESEYRTHDIQKQTIENKNKVELIIKQEETDHQNVIYRVGVEGADIGRHTSNKILILDEGVSRYHSKIIYDNGTFMIKDIGSTTGTFVKLLKMKKLEVGMLLQIGSYTFLVKKIEDINLVLEVTEGIQQLFVIEISVDKRITIGRKTTNKINFPDDAHMSNTHACIFSIKNSLYIEDLEATNGTWLRLSPEGQPSDFYPLSDGDYFKVSAGCTYSVRITNGRRTEKHVPSYCMKCKVEEKDAVLLPCKHNVVCFLCSEKLKECPHCHEEIEERLKIYG